jgi:nucleoside-diphosphate-sugar epimerase
VRILVTGATGQIGTELVPALRERHGAEAVVAAGHRRAPPAKLEGAGPYCTLDVTEPTSVREALETHNIDTVYHLAAVLSAVGEKEPVRAWQVGFDGLRHLLEVAADRGGMKVFWPSSIAAFGPESPRDPTSQDTVMRPTTVYGIAKVAGELLGQWYNTHRDVDVRSVRYPGLISSEAMPGGGTTDYAVDIFHAALRDGRYTGFVRGDTVLPILYMPDALRAAIELMEAPKEGLVHRCSYNLAAMSFSAVELEAALRKHLPELVCRWEPDERQAIADSWPRRLDDEAARREWGWQPRFGLEETVTDMLARLAPRYRDPSPPTNGNAGQ